jgi:hypothetical protein
MPRLDWQMWFAALGKVNENPWFVFFCQRLLEGAPEVKALLKIDPFAAQPPRMVRALLYDYQFTTREEERRNVAALALTAGVVIERCRGRCHPD